MPILYLHSGAPKTGTSYLQSMFAKHSAELAAHSILYPRGHLFDQAANGEITSGNGVELANFIRPNLPHAIENKEGYIEKLSQILSDGSVNILISSEFLSFPDNIRTKAFRELSEEKGYVIKVIYFVRDIVPALFSTYSQAVKMHGEARSIEEYIGSWDPHYLIEITKSETAFGSESVYVYNYEEHRNDIGTFFFDNILNTNICPDNHHRINRSLSSREMEFVRAMNTMQPGNARVAGFVTSALMGLSASQEQAVVTKQEAELLSKKFTKTIDFVNERVRGRSIGLGGSIVAERAAVMATDFERAVAAILAKLINHTLR